MNRETNPMGILRLLLLIVLALLVYRLARRWLDRKAALRRTQAEDKGRMLACAHCGIYFPEQDAVRDGGQVYCSTAHRDAHRKS